jgi:quinol-cytochrome oxidoreductase complex cytochrome b subunit
MTENQTNAEKSVPFYPDHVSLEAKVALVFGILLIAIGIVGLFAPVGLEEPADPMNTPAHVKPEWYFLGLYQLLKFVPKNVGAIGPVIALGILFIWPFLDHKADKSKRATRVRLTLTAIGVILFISLTIWGFVS